MSLIQRTSAASPGGSIHTPGGTISSPGGTIRSQNHPQKTTSTSLCKKITYFCLGVIAFIPFAYVLVNQRSNGAISSFAAKSDLDLSTTVTLTDQIAKAQVFKARNVETSTQIHTPILHKLQSEMEQASKNRYELCLSQIKSKSFDEAIETIKAMGIDSQDNYLKCITALIDATDDIKIQKKAADLSPEQYFIRLPIMMHLIDRQKALNNLAEADRLITILHTRPPSELNSKNDEDIDEDYYASWFK